MSEPQFRNYPHCGIHIVQPGQKVEPKKHVIACTIDEFGQMQEWEAGVNARYRAKFCNRGNRVDAEGKEAALALIQDALRYWYAVQERDLKDVDLTLRTPMTPIDEYKLRKIFHEQKKLYDRAQEHELDLRELDVKKFFAELDRAADDERKTYGPDPDDDERKIDAEIEQENEDDMQDYLQTQDIH